MELSVYLNATISEERITIAFYLCLCLGATHAACVARFGLVPLSLPLEPYAFYTFCRRQFLHTYHPALAFCLLVFFLVCLHPCTLPHTCTSSQWISNVRIGMTIASCLCLCLGAMLPTCVGCFACCHFPLLTFPAEPLYAFYALCNMFLPHHC